MHGFDEIFRSESVRVIRAPVAAPKAKAHAERWVGSARRECIDRLLIVSRKHLERVLREYVEYYNTHRPHRALQRCSALAKPPPAPPRAEDLVGFAAAIGSAASCTSTSSRRSRRRVRVQRRRKRLADVRPTGTKL